MCFALIALLGLQTETAQTEHFEVISTFRDPAYVKSVASVLEAALPGLMSALGLKSGDKEKYRVNLYATLDEYLEKDRELNEGRFASNGGFSHPKTGEAYLHVAPMDGTAVMLDQRQGLLLHEAFHLVTYRKTPWINGKAAWLEEGLAERAVEEVERTTGGDPLMASIKFANAVRTVRDLKNRATLIPLGTLLEEEPGSYDRDLKKAAWYYEAWLFVKFLKERRIKKWSEFLGRCEAPIPGAAAYQARAVKKLLLECLEEGIVDLEKEWIGWIENLKAAPWWRVVDQGGDWRLTRDGVEGSAAPDKSTYLVSSEPLRGRSITVGAEVQVKRGGTGQADLVLFPAGDDPDGSNLVKACITRKGFATLLVRRNEVWVVLANRDFDASQIKDDAWIRLELEVNNRSVTFRAAGKPVIEHEFKDSSDVLDDVRWGLGNFGSWTRFREIEAKSHSK